MEIGEGEGKRKETFLLAPPPSFMFLFSFQLLFQWKKHFHLTATFLEPLKKVFFFPHATVTLSNLIVSMHDYP